MILREISGVESNGKNTRKLIDVKWANCNGETLEQSVGNFSLLLLDS
jgi:hypothetical protein